MIKARSFARPTSSSSRPTSRFAGSKPSHASKPSFGGGNFKKSPTDRSEGIIGPTIEFTNTSTNAKSYVWDFGDGNTSTAANPTHTYSNYEVRTVTLKATNGSSSATATTVIDVPI